MLKQTSLGVQMVTLGIYSSSTLAELEHGVGEQQMEVRRGRVGKKCDTL